MLVVSSRVDTSMPSIRVLFDRRTLGVLSFEDSFEISKDKNGLTSLIRSNVGPLSLDVFDMQIRVGNKTTAKFSPSTAKAKIIAVELKRKFRFSVNVDEQTKWTRTAGPNVDFILTSKY